MGAVVRRYIDILTILINFPYSTCISFFGSSILPSVFILKILFVLFLLFLYNIIIANVTQRTFKTFKKIEIIISIIKNVERASTARARESRDFHVRGTECTRMVS